MREYYGSLSPEPTQPELRNRSLARRAAAEGFVLLKNEGGALPLNGGRQGGKLALYGAGARRTVKGGTGSGSLENRYNVNIEEGLKNAGFEITSAAWLDDYDREYETAYRAWHDYVEEQVKDLTDTHDIIVKAHSYIFQAPDARAVEPGDVEGDEADTAVYVITRQAGEGHDRRLAEGDYYLTRIEKESLALLGRSYAHVVVVVNVGGLVDFAFLDEIQGIDALVLYVQGGEEGGNALADVLSGKVPFSGKTAMTIPMRYEDIPFGDHFSYLGADPNNSSYSEGIYVGYRYYDSFGVPVRFPFGFGLTYTDFALRVGNVRIEDARGLAGSGEDSAAGGIARKEANPACRRVPAGADADTGKIMLDVTVTNTGEAAGKEVVQVYVSAPAGDADREYQRLVAFAKTKELLPGQTQTLTLSFSSADLASYDEESASWYLDAGDYAVRVGDSSRDTTPAAVLRLAEKATVLQCRNCQVPSDKLPEFHPAPPQDAGPAADAEASARSAKGAEEGKRGDRGPGAIGAWKESVLSGDVPVLEIDPACLPTRIVDYTEPAFDETPEEKAVLDSLRPEEQLELLRGGDLQNPPRGTFDIPGAGGKTGTGLLEKGIPDVIFADGPAGISIMSHVFAMPDGSFAAAEVPDRYNWGAVGRRMAAALERVDAPHVYRYATAWPVAMLLAQSWDTDLLEEIGDAVGGEMEAFGITVWLAPGMNIQKNTLGGRTFEYYSEDPVVSGRMAAALTRGVQRHPGRGVSLKHFCCNNIEDNRLHISANVSERALREIYLRGFEIAVKEAAPMTVMSSYNLVNHIYTANSRDLLTDILRCEWGFQGLVMSDWGSCDEGEVLYEGTVHAERRGDPAMCPMAGNDLVMPGNAGNVERMKEALSDGSLDPAAVRRSAGRVLRIILNARHAAERTQGMRVQE